MKTTTLALILFLTGFDLRAQLPPAANVAPTPFPGPRFPMGTNGLPVRPAIPGTPAPAAPATSAGAANPMAPATPPATAAPSNTAAPAPASSAAVETEVPGYRYNFQGVDANQVLDIYADLVGRTVLRAGLPNASIVLHTQSDLTRSEAIQALQAVLALNGISLVNIGDKFVKALPSTDANSAAGRLDYSATTNLPELGSYVTHIAQLKYVKPSEMVQILTPFAKLQNSILAIDNNGILVLRDYAENVKRMLEMIDRIDVSVPAEYISEVIPIKYAMAEDIANALGSLGGSGATVSVGGSSAAAPISGINSRAGGAMGATGMGGAFPGGAANQPRTLGAQANPGGTPTTGTSFQQRLQAIINRSSGGAGGQQDQIQLFGQTKIIADQRANALLVFATRPDMVTITNIISKLDVLLSQVLIESAIIDYSTGPNTLNFGISAAQSPKTFSGNAANVTSGTTAGAGGINNSSSGSPFLNLFSLLTGGSLSNNVFGNNLPGGLSYFGNIGPNWDVALTAAAQDSHASIIQRPRIQTSQAKPAQFFVGDTVPYITGYGNYGYGNQSSYSQLSVGVELDVTPFINPDGLVVMDIQQEIDDLNGFTTIQNIGDVPNTIKRTLSSEVAVRDRDTIMLGGFIKSNKSTSRSGVPLLMDIPLLGNLFTQRSDKKQREELIVLMRPTVLKTPELAAAQAVAEERRLPGVSAVEAEDVAAERKQVEAERKAELRHSRIEGSNRGFYNVPATNSVAPQSQDNGFFGPPPVGPLNTNSAASPEP
ncbi:MAG: secretin N-terminal domain-containing protein [Verrucomicrobiota bacterium]|jgi:general secretion pathway protein D